jgi:hypothetical protein
MQYFINLPVKTKLLLLGLVGIVILTTVIIALQPSPGAPDSEQPKVTPSQTTIIGRKITPESEKRLDITKKEATSEGKTIYSLKSQNAIRSDQIITQNEQVIFQRYYVPENPADPNHLLIDKMLETNGQPEKIIKGSKLWGPYMNTYIYGSRGLAFIGNPNTNEVYEVQNFKPVSIEEYLRLYGDDIDETPPGGES